MDPNLSENLTTVDLANKPESSKQKGRRISRIPHSLGTNSAWCFAWSKGNQKAACPMSPCPGCFKRECQQETSTLQSKAKGSSQQVAQGTQEGLGSGLGKHTEVDLSWPSAPGACAACGAPPPWPALGLAPPARGSRSCRSGAPSAPAKRMDRLKPRRVVGNKGHLLKSLCRILLVLLRFHPPHIQHHSNKTIQVQIHPTRTVQVCNQHINSEYEPRFDCSVHHELGLKAPRVKFEGSVRYTEGVEGPTLPPKHPPNRIRSRKGKRTQ